ncbi:copper amine oxidase N-terminal domain-containing protein [Paenibacillus sp. KQZ6P-2]|uniref:Copper amine oxidase N-terminal domain-containing protein n=1 Tax=Paenibacillus mangrovi TaxID=2931978 RepID=A0A9X1WKX3_9BACL|nr:copper amine oxidase N-terminal domain-containing protein [Paenibacillus mangrovi]MCJ8010779.1 copper amine oxidase N-terminal domain-containing protein [Paenibacillus mangrovi]
MNKYIKRSGIIMTVIFLFFSLMNVCGQTVKADSPLTSTTFYQAYMDIDFVAEAHQSGLNQEIAKFLSSKESPLDQRAAVINAIYSNWNEWNDRNVTDEYSKAIYGKPAALLELKNLRGDELFVLGYLKALDHYMYPDPYWLGLAREALPDSMTVELIYSLVKSQESPEAVWCYMERLFDDDLNKDIRQEALDIIADYIYLYKHDQPCQDAVSELISNSIAMIINQPEALIYGQLKVVDPDNSTVAPYVKNGTTYVPLTFISKSFGATVYYDKKQEEVTIAHENLNYPYGKIVFGLTGTKTKFEVRNGRAFVPLRAIATQFRMQVYYHQGLIILSKGITLNPKLEYDQFLANKVREKIQPNK